MSNDIFEVIEPGLLTTVQDLGRYGFQKYGIPVSGAMDTYSLRLANILIGNAEEEAGLEITVLGPKLRILARSCIVITGADIDPKIDGHSVSQWVPIDVHPGNILTFGAVSDGMRSYVSVAGGIDVPMLLGSRSTYTKSNLGGYHGRSMKIGDIIKANCLKTKVEISVKSLPKTLVFYPYGHVHNLRVVLGPQDKAFTAEGISTFLDSEYIVSIQSDRVGYRLEGPVVEHSNGFDIISDGSSLGSVQIPGDGCPIVLMSDRGTTGGYTKIATVISTDIYKLAQAMAGDRITFTLVNIDEAENLLRKRETSITQFANSVRCPKSDKKLKVLVNETSYNVIDMDGEEIVPMSSRTGQVRHMMTANVSGRKFSFNVQIESED